MIFTQLDDIHDKRNQYVGVIANSLSASGAIWEQPVLEMSTMMFTIDLQALEISRVVDEAFAAVTEVLNKPNLAKETVIKQIDNIPDDPDSYDEDEAPPDQGTKDAAKQLILGVTPSGLLVGADVYGYYGSINVCWETQRRKLKLTIPPHDSHGQPSLYHGQMQQGSVTESATEHNATAKTLRVWLDWLQG